MCPARGLELVHGERLKRSYFWARARRAGRASRINIGFFAYARISGLAWERATRGRQPTNNMSKLWTMEGCKKTVFSPGPLSQVLFRSSYDNKYVFPGGNSLFSSSKGAFLRYFAAVPESPARAYQRSAARSPYPHRRSVHKI